MAKQTKKMLLPKSMSPFFIYISSIGHIEPAHTMEKATEQALSVASDVNRQGEDTVIIYKAVKVVNIPKNKPTVLDLD